MVGLLFNLRTKYFKTIFKCVVLILGALEVVVFIPGRLQGFIVQDGT